MGGAAVEAASFGQYIGALRRYEPQLLKHKNRLISFGQKAPGKFVKAMQLELDQMENAAERASNLMKTLGHRDRLMILCQLLDGEKSVGQLAEALGLQQSPLSQHLARMRKERLVTTRRESQTIYYSLANRDVTKVIGVLYELYCNP